MEKQDPHYTGHRQRILEKFQKNPESFSDYELIELLLTFSIPRIDVKPIAKELIKNYPSIQDLLNEDVSKLCKTKGISEKSATLLNLVAQICKFSTSQQIKGKTLLKTWNDLKLYCISHLSHKKHEEFHVLYLDTKGALIKDETISSGTIDYATIYPRNIIKQAMETEAKSLLLIHNHPSGNLTPSINDINITKDLFNMLSPLGITLIDHIIVGKNEIQTFKDLGFWEKTW